MFRALGAILVGALLIAAANTDIPSPLPWAFGLLPVALLWLARKVGLLLGALAATATLGALYASGIHEPHQLVFIACSRRRGSCWPPAPAADCPLRSPRASPPRSSWRWLVDICSREAWTS